MCSLPVFVGLDYHDASVRVCVLDTDGRELANARRKNACVGKLGCYGACMGHSSVERRR
jgi:hypothetical protein